MGVIKGILEWANRILKVSIYIVRLKKITETPGFIRGADGAAVDVAVYSVDGKRGVLGVNI